MVNSESSNNDNNDAQKEHKPWYRRALRFVWVTLFTLLVLLILLILFVRSPWGQDIITQQVTEYVSNQTKTEVSIQKLYVTFMGDITVKGVYLEDQQSDTLFYSKKLQADIPIWPIIQAEPISIDNVEWTGLRVNIARKDSSDGFNYQFLIDAFSSDSTAPDTTQSTPEIDIGSITFSDFNINYIDAVGGLKAHLELGKFHFQGEDFNLKKMKFAIDEITLKNTKLVYVQTKARTTNTEEDTTNAANSTLPFLSLNDLTLNNVTVHYKSIPGGLEAHADLPYFLLQLPKVDLANQSIQIGKIALNKSDIRVKMEPTNQPKPESKKTKNKADSSEKQAAFEWPDWNVTIETIAFRNNHLHYQMGKKPAELNGFNPNYIDLKNLTLKIDEFNFSEHKKLNVQLSDFSFAEASGFNLKQLSLSLNINNSALNINDFYLQTGNSTLSAYLKTQYQSIDDFINSPKKSEFVVSLNQFAVDLTDAFILQPNLKSNEYIKKLSRSKLTGTVKAKGTLAEMHLPTFLVKWGNNTRIETHGKFLNLADPDKLVLAIDHFIFETRRKDIVALVPEDSLGITIPKTIRLASQLHGGLNDLRTHTLLIIPEGKIKLEGHYANKNQIAYNATLNVSNIDVGKILQNPNIGRLDFTLKSSGQGHSIGDMTAELHTYFNKLEYNHYDFSALQIAGAINRGNGNININYKDKNLDLAVDTKVKLDSVTQKFAVNFDLNGADLYRLGLMNKKAKTAFQMKAQLRNINGNIDLKGHISKGTVVYNEENYRLGAVDFSALIKQDTTAFDINSTFLNTTLRSNTGPDRLTKALKHHFTRYFSDSIATVDSSAQPVRLKMKLNVSPDPLITQLLMPNIKSMDTLNLAMNFNQQKELLTAELSLPHLDYTGNTVDSLQFSLHAAADAGQFKFGFRKLNAGSFVMNRTFWKGQLKDGRLTVNFNALNTQGQKLYASQIQVSGKNKNIKLHISPDQLILNGKSWNIPADNRLLIKKDSVIVHNFVLSRENQRLKIANDLVDTQKANIGIDFENFKLTTFLALFNPQNYVASGILRGHIAAVNPLGDFGLAADLNINKLKALQVPLGDLSLHANSKKAGQYNFNMELAGDDVNLNLKGNYAGGETSPLNISLNLNKFGLKTIAGLSGESLTNGSGYLSGKITAHTDTSGLEYNGFLKFNDASFKVTSLSTAFSLTEDKIDISSDAVTFNQFSIEDRDGSKFTIDGSISTQDITNPEFDLALNADNFLAMHSTKKENESYYGIVNFDLGGTITGKMSFPKVDLNIGINENTDATYVLSESQAAIQEQEGVVTFVNKGQPDNVLTQSGDSTQTAQFTGMQLHANIDIALGATFGVIIDPRTGDNFKISGEGALDFRIKQNGQMALTGRYIIGGGYYQMTLYNLVKRRFEFKPGSSIIWRGNPLDAALDVTAIYSVKTSGYDLMAAQISGLGSAEQSKYRQRLPFLVLLHVEGTIDRPELSFGLDMPEKAQGALGGAVYGRINQLNQNAGALNKQVFSLLVFNRFYPAAGSDGSEGGVATIARNNLNRMLSNQLNAFSDRLLNDTGLQLNFGLESYQGVKGQTDTDLNISAQKSFFNDRLIIKAGTEVNVQGGSRPGEESPLLGNASIEYLLTKDGRWRARLFRKNTYENVIDGQVIVNGIGVLFQHQFNEFYELWESLFGSPQTDKSTQ